MKSTQAKTTVDHDEIREWVESRGGSPARVKKTGRKSDPGILRVDFPGFSGERTLEHMEWDEWFAAFDQNKLAFLYQENVKSGQESRFSKLVARKNATTGRSGRKTSAPKRSAAPKRGAAKKRAATKRPSSARKGRSTSRGAGATSRTKRARKTSRTSSR
jgi:hypothetical protein